jgi:hypothetical protein
MLRREILLGTTPHVVDDGRLFVFPPSAVYLFGDVVFHCRSPNTRYR